MYSSKEKALEALNHCIHLDDPFHPDICGASCPLWRQCTGTSQYVILSDLRDVIYDIGFHFEQTEKICSTITRCMDMNNALCDSSCPYWDGCRGDNNTQLFRDIHELLKGRV